jgi:hypothetical protein
MKYLSVLFISISLLSCKEDIAVSPPLLTGPTWALIESRENLNLTIKPADFIWRKFERQSNGSVTYQFTTDSIIEYDYPCAVCYRSLIIRGAKYSKVDKNLKIQVEPNKELLIIYGNSSNSIVRLTKDTLIIGKNNFGREGDYSEFKFVRLK